MAIVLSTTEERCTVVMNGEQAVVQYAPFFPQPRTERVAPGHLVALTDVVTEPGGERIVWRWFDALVTGAHERSVHDGPVGGGSVSLWEPGHGAVAAVPRMADRQYRPGGRAYLSAGLPGADWWVAGPAVDRAEDADVELSEVAGFLTGLGLLAPDGGPQTNG